MIYISLPIGGHETTVKDRYNKAINDLKELGFNNNEIIGPININDFDNTGLTKERDHDWAWYMGKDVEILLRCDKIYMTQGFNDSPGCRVELAIAKAQQMNILFAKNSRDSLIA